MSLLISTTTNKVAWEEPEHRGERSLWIQSSTKCYVNNNYEGADINMYYTVSQIVFAGKFDVGITQMFVRLPELFLKPKPKLLTSTLRD